MIQPSPDRFGLAFASLPEPTLLLDEEGRLASMNGAAEALLGKPHAAPGRPVARLYPWLGPAVDRVLAGADEAGLEAEVATPDGRRCVAARLRRVGDRCGALRGAVAVLEDLTEKRAIEAAQRSAERLAALGTMAAGLAHEVNNPLACVVAGLSFVEAEHERLASTLAPAELSEAKMALEEARDAALRVSRIMRALPSFGQPSEPLAAQVDLSRVARAAVRLAEPEASGRASLVAECSPAVTVRANESLLLELFLALLANAAQAIAPGDPDRNSIRVTVAAEGGQARVVVRDTGAGISEPGRERALDPVSRTPPGRSTGLGLSVSRGIVAALGGTLSLEPAAGGGTAATVLLPLDCA